MTRLPRRAGRGRGARSAVEIGKRRAVDPFGGEHLRGRCAASRSRARGSPDRRRRSCAISAIAPASMRRSISSLTDCAKVSTAATRPQPSAFGTCALDRGARQSGKLSRSRANLLLDAGPQDLHRDVATLAGRRAMHLRDRGGGDRRAEFREQRLDRHAEIGERSSRAPRPSRTAAGGPAARAVRRPRLRRQCRAVSRGTGRA